MVYFLFVFNIWAVLIRGVFNRVVLNRGVFNRAVLNRGVFNRAVLNRGVFNKAVNLIDLQHSTKDLVKKKPVGFSYLLRLFNYRLFCLMVTGYIFPLNCISSRNSS